MKAQHGRKPRTAARRRETERRGDQEPGLYCPHVDPELDDAAVCDVADFDELRLRSTTSGEKPSRFPLNVGTGRE